LQRGTVNSQDEIPSAHGSYSKLSGQVERKSKRKVRHGFQNWHRGNCPGDERKTTTNAPWLIIPG
jgi:hypothetical protein